MSTTNFYFLLSLPTGQTALWIGRGLRKAKRAGHVVLMKPDGSPGMELPRHCVRPTTLEAFARAVAEAAKARQAHLN